MTKHTSLFLVSLSSLKRARPTFLYPHQADRSSSMDLDDLDDTKAFQCHEPGTLTSCI